MKVLLTMIGGEDMTIKEFLRDIKRKKTTIEMLEEQMARLKSMAVYKGTAVDPNGGGRGSGNPHSTEDVIVKALDISSRLDRTKVELMNEMEQATNMIMSLSDEKVLNVFRKRYLDFQTWERIADEMGITFQWVHELHKRGLIELAHRYPDFL